MIDMASVYANKYRQNPQALQAAVLGQSPDPRLDPYTALNALKLVNESNRMTMAGQAQQPTSSPSLVAQNMAPQAGLGAMVPGAMGQMGQAPQGMPPQAPAAPAPVMQRSGGLAGLPTPEPKYAQGGIVAFQSGGKTAGQERDYTQEVLDSIADDQRRADYGTEQEPGWDNSEGSASAQDKFNAYLMKQLKDLEGYEPKEMTDAEQSALYKKFMEREEKLAGPNIYKPANEDLKKREGAIAGNERYGQGLALISAAGQMLRGRNIAEGASNAAPAFAQQMAEVKRATMQEQRSIEQMKFSYADAERKERAGMHRAAQASVDSARKFQQDANKANFDKRRALADLAVKGSQANKPRAGGAGAGPKLAEQLYADNVANLMATNKPKQGESQEAFTARIRAQAGALTAQQTKTSFSTGESGPGKLGAQQEALTSKENIEANKALDKHKLMNGREWKKSVEAAGSVEAAEKQFKSKWITNNPQSVEGASPSAKPTAAPKPATATKVVSMADVDATVTASGKTRQEVMDALKAKGYTVK